MAQWSRQRADWSDHHNPPVSKVIANEWIVKAFGVSLQFQQLGLGAVIPKELISLHVKVQQLQEAEPATLEGEGQALDDEWSELSKERDHWAQDRTNMKREDDMCADEDVRYKQEHEYVLMYRDCRQDKITRIERDLEALDTEIKSRNKAHAQRKLRHEALDKEYELEWKKAQDARMEFTTLRMAQHNDRITRAKKRCETLGEQLSRQQKSQRLLLFKRAAMNEERDADTTVFTDHKDGCKAALESAKSSLAMAPEYVNRLNGDVDINSEETSDIVASNYRTPMEGDEVDERDHFMNDVRARRAQFQAELDVQQSNLAAEHEVCESLLERITGFITRLSEEVNTATDEDVLINEYQGFLENEKQLIDDEEACREQKKAYLSSLMTDAGNWVLDALHDHSKRKKREADRLVKQAVRASELQRLVQHFTHRVIEQEERIMRQKQRILQGEHKLEMLKSSDSWYLYVTVHTPDIGKHDAKCLETARKEREEDMVQGNKLLNEDESDVNSVTSELEKSKACAEEKAVKRDVWAYVEDVYNPEKPQEKDEDMMMTSQIRGLVAQLGETFEMLTNRLAEEDESLQHAYANLCSEVESIKCFMERIESEESALSTAEKASLQKEIQVRKAESDLVEQRARALNANYKSIASEHAKLPVSFDGVRKTRAEREVPLKLREAELEVIRRLVKTRNYYDRKTCAEFAKKFVPHQDMKEVRDALDWLLVAVDGDIKAVDRWMELSKGERKEMSLLSTKASEIDWDSDMLTKIPAFIEVDQMIKEKGAAAVHAKEQWVVDLINVKRAIASKDKDLCFVIDETLTSAKKEEVKVNAVLDKLKASKEEVINTLRFIDQEEANAVRSGKPLEVENNTQPQVVYQSNRKPVNRVTLPVTTQPSVPEEQEQEDQDEHKVAEENNEEEEEGRLAESHLLQVWSKYRPAKALDVDGKHVFITGGSQGLGLAIAKYYAVRGAKVSIVARRKSVLEEAATELEKLSGHRVFIATCDVTDLEAVKKVVEQAIEFQQRSIDHLVCNAGISIPGFFVDQSVDLFKQHMNINYFGAVHTCKAALPTMIERGGKIIFINSGCGLMSFAGFSQYAASKFALRGFADALRNEIILDSKKKIDVHCFYPGSIDTPMFAQEQASKPQVAKDIEGTTEVVTPENATECLMRGVANGTYAITNDIGIWTCRVLGHGIYPRELLVVMFEMVFSPILVIVQVGFGWYMDRLASSQPIKKKLQVD
ncbi:hypothetical protein THRCLA_06616 [Thraustotheca clavata]|uniref:3-dehydrosphinganine reductase n=1 Tax=Thraustotheca clavata TaxID=74557 RepID=A0A1V9ZLS8_9STRA|nr:hypothetical protein THRCLA_06616 [Thraustotheca clavata]